MIPDGDGGELEATVMPFQAAGEHWNEYLVDDGTVIKIKLVVTEVLRVDDKYDGNGDPVYLIHSQNVVNVSAPESLRKRS
jgi:hypothetical protein